MINQNLAQLLSEITDMLELKGDNPFRIRAFRRAVQTIESYPEDLGAMSREQHLAIPGIGKGIADIIDEFKTSGRVREHEALRQKFPAGVLEMMKLGGLGPKRVAILFKELRIDSIQKLRSAAEKGVLKDISGFGLKTQENILKSISYSQETSKRLLISKALRQAADIKNFLIRSPHIKKLELAGSARRWKETIGDVDFLCTSKEPEKAITHFVKYNLVERVLASGSTKASVLLKSGLQCDFRVVEEKSFGAALLYFTGSKEHNVRLRELAQKKGFTLNEYGLFKLNGGENKPPVASSTEEDVYEALGLQWIPPELREDRGEIEKATAKKIPTLVTERDVLGDFHNHTVLSDGANTMEEMLDAAERAGWEWYFCGDHSPSLKVASGLPVSVLRDKIKKLRKLDSQKKGIRAFCSSEVDILADGRMDYPDDVLNELDCVVASVHTKFNMTEEEMTDRICRALTHPHVDILGHISGRLISRRNGYPVHYETVLQTAKKTQTAIEINGQPERLELSDVYVKRAVELGVPLALTTDAHSINDLENMVLSVHVARRGWAEPRHLLNTMPVDEVLKWLKD